MKLTSLTHCLVMLFAAGTIDAYCGNMLCARNWYLLPKIGIAPNFFTHHGYEHCVVPLGSNANSAFVCTDIDGLGSVPVLQAGLSNTIVQQNACKIPTFRRTFSDAVLHVGVEIGRTMCHMNQLYLEFVYDRAKGHCLNNTTSTYASPDGCSSEHCSIMPTGPVLTTSNATYQYSNYTAYGGYLGSRYYADQRYLCERVAVWGAFKFGILHRRPITACVTVPEKNETVNGFVYTFDAATLPLRTIYCSSNAVSGGLSIGCDYRAFDCLSLMLGVEITASCALTPNSNVNHVLAADPTPAAGAPTIPSGYFAQPTNTFPGSTGIVAQMPVWLGFRFEWEKRP